MKKQKKKYVIYWVVSACFAISISASFKDGIPNGLLCVFLTALFFYLGLKNFKGNRAKKESTGKAPKVASGHSFPADQPSSPPPYEDKKSVPSPIAVKERASASVPAPPAQKEVSSPSKSAPASTFARAGAPRAAEKFESDLEAIPRVEINLSKEKAVRNAPSDMPEIKYSNITKKTVLKNLFPLVVIDTETTGLSPRGNDIIEVSAIKFDVDFVPVSCFTTLLKSRRPIPADASSVNGITDEMVKEKPFFSEIASSFSEYISGCNIVGHNLPFDLKFLFVCGATLPEKSRYYDTLQLAKHTLIAENGRKWDKESGTYVSVDEYDVENYKLDTLCEYYGIHRNGSHRSLSDSFATAKVFEYLIEDKRA